GLACAIATLGALIVRRHHRAVAALVRICLVVLILAGAAAINIGMRSSMVSQSPYRDLAEREASATIEARVVSEPTLVRSHGQQRAIVELNLQSAEHGRQTITGSGTVTAFA